MPADRSPNPLKVVAIVCGALLASLVGTMILVFLVGWFFLGGKDHPSDAQLESLLRTRRPQIDSLVEMARADRMDVVDHDWSRPDSTLTPERWDRYRELFDRLDVESGIRQYQPGTFALFFSTRGLATGGSAKGLVLHPRDPSPLLPDLDERPPGKNFGKGYKKLWGGWYIFHEWDG